MQTRLRVLLLIGGFVLIGAGFFVAFQLGYLRPFADVNQANGNNTLTDTKTIQAGAFDSTQYTNGAIGLTPTQ